MWRSEAAPWVTLLLAESFVLSHSSRVQRAAGGFSAIRGAAQIKLSSMLRGGVSGVRPHRNICRSRWRGYTLSGSRSWPEVDGERMTAASLDFQAAAGKAEVAREMFHVEQLEAEATGWKLMETAAEPSASAGS